MLSWLPMLPLLRGLHLLCLVSLLGTLTARCVIAPGFTAGRAQLVRLAHISLALAVPTLLLWVVVQAASFADAASPAEAIAALPTVALDTRFGHVLLLRLALLVAIWPLIGRGRIAWIAGAVLAGIALALQAAVGHAGAVGGGASVGLVATESLHLIAAGTWLGGLLPLLILVLACPPPQAAEAARRFTAIGLPAVMVLMATALAQAQTFIGGLPGLFGTEYGHVALVKLALFMVLLGLALLNRFVLAARFESRPATRMALVAAIGLETLAGMAVVLAAAMLASQEPGIHEQPLWPFVLRPSTVALADPDIRSEVLLALAGGAAGLLIVIAGLAWRRGRLVLIAAGVVLVGFAAPHLRPWLVEAYPTSYDRSPTDFSVTSIVRGAALYAANCATCHGAAGRGDGRTARGLAVPPADLTAAHLWEHSDGELFWWLTHGMDNPEGGLSMPGFAAALSEDERWALIDFIRANNAGLALRDTGQWPQPIQAPDLPVVCADGTQADMGALRGRLVQVAAAAAPTGAVPPAGTTLVTLHLSPNPDTAHVTDGCLAATADAWPAYAILTGIKPAALAGTVVLVDPSGWLRAAFPTDGEADTAGQVTALLAEILSHPIAATTGEQHAHVR